jgi:hypothetical protein
MTQSLNAAQTYAWNLATTLMVCITLFRAGNGFFSVCPSSEFDGDPDWIVHDYDPWEIMDSPE